MKKRWPSPDVIGLVIGTRPDCVNGEKLDYIAQLAQKHYIIIEYGVESIYNTTLEKINRGHTFEQAVKAIEETKKRNIKTGAHFIIGLPCETEQMLFDAIPVISGLPLDSIKFHQLQIFKGTAMAAEYLQNPEAFSLYSLEQYLELIVKIIERLNPSIVIERIAGEAPPRHLACPSWGLLRVNDILRLFEQKLEEKDTWQGKFY